MRAPTIAIPPKNRSGSTITKPQPIKPKSKNIRRGQWKEEDMHLALAAIASKTMSMRQARESYGIPPSSIQDWKK